MPTGRDYDETLLDPSSAADFERALQTDISGALDIDHNSIIVLCHRRGSIITEVVLCGQQDKTPSCLANELVAMVRKARRGDVAAREVGRFVKDAKVQGPIARGVCAAVRGALAGGVVGSCNEPALHQQVMAIETDVKKLEGTVEEAKAIVDVFRGTNTHKIPANASEDEGRSWNECWDDIMLQIVEATDRELDRELGLLSHGREAAGVTKRLQKLPQFKNGISSLADITTLLPQLQEEHLHPLCLL